MNKHDIRVINISLEIQNDSPKSKVTDFIYGFQENKRVGVFTYSTLIIS